MKIIKGITGSGKTSELIKRFCETDKALLITDEISKEEVAEIISYRGFEVLNITEKDIITSHDSKFDFDRFISIVHKLEHTKVFAEFHSPWFTKNILIILGQLKQIEQQEGIEFTIAIQLNLNHLETTGRKFVIETF